MGIEIPIIVRGIKSADLYHELSEIGSPDFSLELRERSGHERGPLLTDPTILAALITISYSAVAALVSAVLRAAKKKMNNPVAVLHGPGGWRIEFPAGTPLEEILRFIEQSNRLDFDELRVQPGKQ